ncbi:Uncharacterized protein HZ326_0809 [Fusarium oxysporum f. sp. albedinis]|nr:Uncharacterized protein HZ326_0809 [Fusarium oxysporum f. sp. albedinis]
MQQNRGKPNSAPIRDLLRLTKFKINHLSIMNQLCRSLGLTKAWPNTIAFTCLFRSLLARLSQNLINRFSEG